MSDDREPRSKRILHIGKYFPPHRGGMEAVLRDQMNLQTRDEGLQVAAVVHSSERRLTDKVEIQPLGYRVRHAARWFTAVFAPIAPFFWWSVYREIKELDPDQIKIHMPNVSAFWLLLLPHARTRTWVVLWHSDVLPSEKSWGLRFFYRVYKPFEERILRRASKVIATSQTYLEFSVPLRPFRHKCCVEGLRIDVSRIPEHLRTKIQSPKTPGETLRVLCVGRLTYYKDFGTAIKAIAKIPRAQLRIVGEGEERKNLENVIRDLRVENRVQLLGNLSDESVWQEFVWCDVNVLPSKERTEAFGIVILEAAIFGKPSIVSNTAGSGMSWVATQAHERAKIFEADNCESLAATLVEFRAESPPQGSTQND